LVSAHSRAALKGYPDKHLPNCGWTQPRPMAARSHGGNGAPGRPRPAALAHDPWRMRGDPQGVDLYNTQCESRAISEARHGRSKRENTPEERDAYTGAEAG
jgi:hypothetical protein